MRGGSAKKGAASARAQEWDAGLFMRALIADPGSLLRACAMLVESRSPGRLSEIGLSARALEAIASALPDASGPGVAEGLESLALALAGSGLPAEEQRPFAEQLARIGSNPEGFPLADMGQAGLSHAAAVGPGAAVWLACPACAFDAGDVWRALAGASEELALAALAPGGFVEQAVHEQEAPYSTAGVSEWDPRLWAAYVEGVWRSHGASRAAICLEALELSGDRNVGVRGALMPIAARIATSEGFQDFDASFGGWMLQEAFKSAHQEGVEGGGAASMDLVAASCESMRIRPSVREVKLVDGLLRADSTFLFDPSGHGGVELMHLPNLDLPAMSMADYALACSDDSEWAQESPALAALAAKLDESGRSAAIRAGGAPELISGLVDLSFKHRRGEVTPDEAQAMGEALILRCDLGSAAVSKRAILRV